MGCLFTILDYLFIRFFWWWVKTYFTGMWNTIKYMAMLVVSIFAGPEKTVYRLATARVSRETGFPPDEVPDAAPDLYRIARAKTIAWMVWATLWWIIITGLVVFSQLKSV